MPAKYLAGANLKVYWEEWQLNTYQNYIAIYQNGHLKVVTPAFDRFKLIQSPKSLSHQICCPNKILIHQKKHLSPVCVAPVPLRIGAHDLGDLGAGGTFPWYPAW